MAFKSWILVCTSMLAALVCRPKLRELGPSEGPNAVEPLLDRPTPPSDVRPRSGAETVVLAPNEENEGSCTVEGAWAKTGTAAETPIAIAITPTRILICMAPQRYPREQEGF